MKPKTLFALWGGLFVLCAALGFVNTASTALQVLMTVLSIAFFLPGALLLRLSKESACSAGDLGLIPGLGRFPGERKGYSLQYSGLENSMDCLVHRVTKSWTRVSDFHFQLL